MGEQEGSKAMTIYIVVCFVLAAAGLVGYKMMEDRRASLATRYGELAAKIQDMGGARSPSIRDYWNKVQLGLITPLDREAMDNTHNVLREVAKEVGINEAANQFRVDPAGSGADKGSGDDKYKEYKCTVDLRDVTARQWKDFLARSLDRVSKYAVIEVLNAERMARRPEEVEISPTGVDNGKWTVRIEYVWFGPMPETASS